MGKGPLSGVKIIEMAGIGPGPFCAMLLSDMGADIVRIDRKGGAGGYPSDTCLLYTSPSPRDLSTSRMPSSA